MSIRFKFRSSVAFDTIDLGGRCSISVRELRLMIIDRKKLRSCDDFDLVISDAETGKVLENEGIHVNEGSSFVVKRVPKRSDSICQLDVANMERKEGGFVERTVPPPPSRVQNVQNVDLDDFGVELFPSFKEQFPEVDADPGNLKFTPEKGQVVPRCSKTSFAKVQNVEGSDAKEAMPKAEVVGDNCCKEIDTTEEIQKQIKPQRNDEVHKKLDEDRGFPSLMLNMDLPNELKCSLCHVIFKEAVMIPCCQHSFCEKCIQSSLVQWGRCPKCFSMEYTVGSLLPNLTLRQTVKHFLEAQAYTNDLEKKVPLDAPDVESGIHGSKFNYPISVQQRKPPCPASPSEAGASNQVMVEPAFENRMSDWTGKSTPLPLKNKQMKTEENNSAEALRDMASFLGVHSSSKFSRQSMQEEDNADIQKNKGVTAPDFDGNLMRPYWQRKSNRNCYGCGSTDHLMRDCPAAAVSSSHPLCPTGDAAFTGGMPMYGQAYWHGPIYSQARPYGSIYGGAQGMVPFDPSMAPVSPFSMSPYMSSMYNGMPGSYGFMRIGGVQPSIMSGAQFFAEPQDGEQMQKHLNERAERNRGHDHEGMPEDRYDVLSMIPGRAAQAKYSGRREEPHSIEPRQERSSRQSVSGRDQKGHSDKSRSKFEHSSDSSSLRHRENKYLRSKFDEKMVNDHKRSSYMHHHSEHSSSAGRRNPKEKESSHHKMPKCKGDKLDYGRWETNDGYRGESYHKRRRMH